MAQKSDFTDFHDSILNEFKEKKNLSAAEVRRLHTSMMELFYGVAQTVDRLLLDDIRIINEEIRKGGIQL